MVHELRGSWALGWVDGETLTDEVDAKLAELAGFRKRWMLSGDTNVEHDSPIKYHVVRNMLQLMTGL